MINITVQFLDKGNLVMAEEIIVQSNEMPITNVNRSVIPKVLRKYVQLDWVKVLILIEKV